MGIVNTNLNNFYKLENIVLFSHNKHLWGLIEIF